MVDQFLADGAYDGGLKCDLLAERFGSEIEVAILPPKNARFSPNVAWNPTVRDWSCPAYVPVTELIYAAFRSKAKGLLPPNDEWRRRGL
jgi:hypothetical protein